ELDTQVQQKKAADEARMRAEQAAADARLRAQQEAAERQRQAAAEAARQAAADAARQATIRKSQPPVLPQVKQYPAFSSMAGIAYNDEQVDVNVERSLSRHVVYQCGAEENLYVCYSKHHLNGGYNGNFERYLGGKCWDVRGISSARRKNYDGGQTVDVICFYEPAG
ncbi:hypothetical protein, partial [Bradyrhizobium sp. Rc2d]|uniref:hypothetical protein n=1 Tax=Bradyrhizobium sp. Rc2d TaxID=1855321 RepID=UPI0015A2C097